jgi:hypothetical protein
MIFPAAVVRDDEVDYIMNTMRRICKDAPYRLPGSDDEKKGADIFKEEYTKFTDEVTVEPFEMAPDAYPGGMIRPIGWFFMLSVIFFFIFPILSWIVLIPILLWVAELFGLKRAIDWAYPKKPSQNVFAKIKPQMETKTIMMFAGHNDSPLVFPITANLRKKSLSIVITIFVCTLVVVMAGIVRAILCILTGVYYIPITTSGFLWIDYIGVLGICLIPVVFVFTQIFVSRAKCNGANDNLSGAISALALARYFQNNRPLNTELWFVAFGCEEAGQRGSTNFALQHKQEMIDKDAYFVNLESIGGGTFLLFATEETMCIPHIKHNPDVYNLLKDASRYVFTRRQSLRSPLTQGYTDAEAFSRIGIKASTILGLMLDGFPMLWHIKTDIPDNIRPGCMRDAMEICIKAVQIRDEQVSRSSLSRELA